MAQETGFPGRRKTEGRNRSSGKDMKHDINKIWASSQENLSSGFPKKLDSSATETS